jgi:hypothetical protein
LQAPAERAHDLVAHFVAEPVIELLKSVHISHDQANTLAGERRPVQFPRQRLLHESTIKQSGERVADRLLVQGLPQG